MRKVTGLMIALCSIMMIALMVTALWADRAVEGVSYGDFHLTLAFVVVVCVFGIFLIRTIGRGR